MDGIQVTSSESRTSCVGRYLAAGNVEDALIIASTSTISKTLSWTPSTVLAEKDHTNQAPIDRERTHEIDVTSTSELRCFILWPSVAAGFHCVYIQQAEVRGRNFLKISVWYEKLIQELRWHRRPVPSPHPVAPINATNTSRVIIRVPW